MLDYDRSRIAASKLRIKEWDYYLVNDDEYALAFTIGDLGYITMVSASLLDFNKGTYITESTLGILPLGKLGLPTTSAEGITRFEDKRANMCFSVVDGMRLLSVEFNDFKDGEPLRAEIVLSDEPRDSMVIATPWAEDPTALTAKNTASIRHQTSVLLIGAGAYGLTTIPGSGAQATRT